MKTIKIEVEAFKAIDGKIFKTKEACEDHEMRLNGDRITCPECFGKNKVDYFGDGKQYDQCGECEGKGYLDKQIVFK